MCPLVLQDLRLVVARFAGKTEAAELGELTVSMLKGEHGKQKKEVAKVAQWLAAEVKPQVVNLTNAIISGMVHEMKRAVGWSWRPCFMTALARPGLM